MKKTLIFIVVGLFARDVYATAPAGGSASKCTSAVQAANKTTVCIPPSGGSSGLPAASAGDSVPDTGSVNATIAGMGTTAAKAYTQACQKAQQKCDQACQGQSSPDKDRCDWFKKQLDDASKQAGSDDKDKDASKKSSDGSGGGAPSMPTPPKSDDPPQQPTTPQPVAQPASATTDCTADPAGTGCPPQTKQDAANTPPASSFPGSGGSGSASPASSGGLSSDQQQPQQTASAGAGITPPTGGSSGGLGGNNSNPNKEMPPGVYDQAAKNITDVLNGERGGGGSGGGGGGFAGYGAGMEGSSLAAYLPGRNKDPNKPKAGGDRKPASMEVASVHADIFAMITKRFQILCKLKEIRDCD